MQKEGLSLNQEKADFFPGPSCSVTKIRGQEIQMPMHVSCRDPHTRLVTLINKSTHLLLKPFLLGFFFFLFAVPVSLISLVWGLLRFGVCFEVSKLCMFYSQYIHKPNMPNARTVF